jgi:hypothetical protein
MKYLNELGLLLEDEDNKASYRLVLRRLCKHLGVDYTKHYKRVIQTDIYKTNLAEMVFVVREAARKTFDI